MASGFPGGGGAGFYGGISGRSMLQNAGAAPNNNPSQPLPLPSPYRTIHPQQQLPQIFLDQNTTTPLHQIPQVQGRLPSTPTLIGKRTLAEFQPAQHQQQNNLNPALGNLLLLRSVKSRTMIQHQHTYPISTLSPTELSPNNNNNLMSAELPSTPLHHLQRYPLLQQQQQQRASQPMINNTHHLLAHTGPANFTINLQNQNRRVIPAGFQQQESSFSAETKRMVDKRLQELEKQLLDDENDVASVITNVDSNNTSTTNSEWSEHNLNLIASNPISPSPTSSSSSCCSSSSVTNPVPNCNRQTLLEAAAAISDAKNDAALDIISRFSQAASIHNANPEQKLVNFLGKALKSRINPVDDPAPVSDMFSKEHAESTQSLYELSPCFELGFMAANLAILDAARDHDVLHVVDFEVGQGGQYVNLLHALPLARGNGQVPSLVKLTAVHETSNSNCNSLQEERDRLMKVGETLTRLGESVGVPFRFRAVGLNKLNELTRVSLGVETDEALAVNLAFKLFRVPDESVSIENPRDELLRRVKGLSPVVVTLVEQEMNVNTAPFMSRVNEVCSYYGALLESMEATVAGRENGDTAKAEKGIERRIVNSVACEGRERVERCEVFGKWRARFGMAGFGLKPMSQGMAESIRARLNAVNRINPFFTVKEESGGVWLGWMGKSLTVASAWR